MSGALLTASTQTLGISRNCTTPPTRPAPALAIREVELAGWLAKAGPGQRIEYHRGHLGIDRARGMSPLPDSHRRELGRIAERVLALAEEGRILAIQQRHGAADYSYFAVPTRHRGR